MSEPKTKENDASVGAFLEGVAHPTRREDGHTLRTLMEDVTGEPARMWGTNIVGFGSYTYRYASGRSGDWPIAGFSPRKASLSVYIMPGFRDYAELLGRLGKHKVGKSCLYVNKLADVDMDVLRELIEASVDHMRAKYP